MLDRLPKLTRRYTPMPYAKRSEQELTQLAIDHLRAKDDPRRIVTNEGIPEHLAGFIFARLGFETACAQDVAGTWLRSQFPKAPPELIAAVRADAQALIGELTTNEAEMVYEYLGKQMTPQARQSMRLPPTMADQPVFLTFCYLNKEDTKRFCDIRDQILMERVKQEAIEQAEREQPEAEQGETGGRPD